MQTNRSDIAVINSPEAGRSSWHAMAVVIVLALAASLSSLGNGFALDDVHIIAANERVQGLNSWWTLFGQTYWPPEHGASLYRPMTMLMFAVQWAIGGGSPLPFHAVNIALYAALSVAVLVLARRLMSAPAALIAAAVFAVHPVHVEAVANVVGQSELWVGLLVVLSLTTYISARSRGNLTARSALAICSMYLLALSFKEHAIVLPALIAGAEILLFSSVESKVTGRLRRVAPLIAGMSCVAVAFVVLRTIVIGQFAGGSTAAVFQGQDFATRMFTMLKVFPEWVRLFFWPVQLSANYSPGRIETATAFDISMLPAVVAIAAVILIGVRIRREHPGATYALVFAGIALLIPSNLLIVTGFVLAERALLLASVGVALAIGFVVHAGVRIIHPVTGRLLAGATSVLVLAGISISYSRGPVWKDNETLFRQTVLDVPSSYRAHLMLGELLTDEGNYQEGLIELAKAVSLSYPQNVFVRKFAADRFHAAGLLNIAKHYYEQAILLDPSDMASRHGLAACLLSMGDNAGARASAVGALTRDPVDLRFIRMVHVIDSVAALAPDTVATE